jgi:hypothetical protein
MNINATVPETVLADMRLALARKGDEEGKVKLGQEQAEALQNLRQFKIWFERGMLRVQKADGSIVPVTGLDADGFPQY